MVDWLLLGYGELRVLRGGDPIDMQWFLLSGAWTTMPGDAGAARLLSALPGLCNLGSWSVHVARAAASIACGAPL